MRLRRKEKRLMKGQSKRAVAGMAALIAITICAAMPVAAQEGAPVAGVKVGFLNCQVSRGWGLVFGSSRSLKCVYSPAPGVQERYNGKITRFGLDIGYLASGIML